MNMLSALLLTLLPSEQKSVLLNYFSVYSGLRVVCFLYAAMLSSAYFFFSFVIMTKIAVYYEFYFCDSNDVDWAVPSRLAF